MKKLLCVLCVVAFAGCAGVLPVQQHEVIVKVEGKDQCAKVEKPVDGVVRSMEIPNNELSFSRYCNIYDGVAYISLTSVDDYKAQETWSDFQLIRKKGIKTVILYLNNPGGSAMQGMALCDSIRQLKAVGVEVIGEATGLVASAAVPVFLMCSKRVASENTIFLIHPASLWKYGLFSEQEDDLESQQRMLRMCKERYAAVVASCSNLSKDQVLDLLKKDNWFGVAQAQEWGMVDEVK